MRPEPTAPASTTTLPASEGETTVPDGELRELGLLYELIGALGNGRSFEDALVDFVHALAAALDADLAALFLPEHTQRAGSPAMQLRCAHGLADPLPELAALPRALVEIIASQCEDQDAARCISLGADARRPLDLRRLLPPPCPALHAGSAIGLPRHGQVVGVLLVARCEARPLRSTEHQLLEALAGRLAQVLDAAYGDSRAVQGRLAVAVEHAGDAIEITDASGRIEYVNPAFEDLSGYSLAEALGRTPGELFGSRFQDARFYERVRIGVPPSLALGDTQDVDGVADTQPWMLPDEILDAQPRDWSGRIVAQRKDGSQWPIEVTLSPVRDESGALTHFVAVKRDVSQQVEAEAALRQREAVLAAILRSMGDAVIATDTQGRITRMNPVAEHLSGWSEGMARGRPAGEVFQVVHEYTREPLQDIAKRALRSGEVIPATREAALLSRHRAEHPISQTAAPIRDSGGQITGAVIVARDVSDERGMTDELRRSRRELRQVIEKLPDGIVMHRRGLVLYTNPAFGAATGRRSPRELIGQRLESLVHPDDRPRLLSCLRPMPEEQSGSEELRFRRPDDSYVTLELSLGETLELEGSDATLLVARDITERLQIQAQLVLSERMVSVGTLAAGVAHEINNPLTYVMGNLSYVGEELGEILQELGDTGPLPQRLRELCTALAEARDGAERVRSIVADLRAFSRADENHLAPVKLDVVIDLATKMAHNEIRHRAQLIEERGRTPKVLASETRLGQVFLNLLVNAAQALPEGRAESHEIRVRTFTDARGWAGVEVRDTGPGIPREHVAQVFDPFFTTKQPGEGTGLGLSICHGIVSGYGGEIRCESEVGAGSCFTVLLPPAPVSATDTTEQIFATPLPVARPARVLIVDDEGQVARAVMRQLREHDVVICGSGREALALLDEDDGFDVILCDLMMPDMPGMDLHSALAERSQMLAQRVVFMTGGAFTPRAREFLETVSSVCLEKPLDPRQLQAVIAARIET